MQDAPISRIDLLLCRNTLMYFNSEAQSRILARFHFSLTAGRLRMLGTAEMLFTPRRAVRPGDLNAGCFVPFDRDRITATVS